MTEQKLRARQIMRIDRSIRMRAACVRLSSDALNQHNRRLYERRERMVVGVVGEYESVHGTGLIGKLFDVTTDMQFAVWGILQDRATRARWAAESAARRGYAL